MGNDAEAYLQLLRIAYVLGEDLVDAIKTHAEQHLSAADFAALKSKFDEDAERAKKNAGLS